MGMDMAVVSVDESCVFRDVPWARRLAPMRLRRSTSWSTGSFALPGRNDEHVRWCVAQHVLGNAAEQGIAQLRVATGADHH